jgi:hypothetical protein
MRCEINVFFWRHEEFGKAVSESVKHDITDHIVWLQDLFQEHFRLVKNEKYLAEKSVHGSLEVEKLPLEEYEDFIYTVRKSVTKTVAHYFSFKFLRRPNWTEFGDLEVYS